MPLGPWCPRPFAINVAGTILGNYTLRHARGFPRFVRSEEGIVSSFDPPRSSSTTATSINDSGVIAGYYTDESGKVVSGFLRPPLETTMSRSSHP